MKFVLFYHSLRSDWNHGNAHFLRGVSSELISRGHSVVVYEPMDAWSVINLLQDEGRQALEGFSAAYPTLFPHTYDLAELDLDRTLADVDVVIAHEWNDPHLIARLNEHRAAGANYRLFFHDTHHRCVTATDEMRRYRLDAFDGVLAFGEIIRQFYLEQGWAGNAWTWHEAADTRIFQPLAVETDCDRGDVVWIGNWGDEERSQEIMSYLLEPIKYLKATASVFGVRYPELAISQLRSAGVDYRGWLPNYHVPETFARFHCTLHIPRRPYRESLLGVPTIRVFEALACGIPLISLRWEDTEGLFDPGEDFVVIDSPSQMRESIRMLLNDAELRQEFSQKGRETILSRHTCLHRVDELLAIVQQLNSSVHSGASTLLESKD